MRIGIYGGSFSPPHKGHVRLCEEFLRAANPDRMLIIPAGVPPHKRLDGGADPAMRLEMCRAAFSHISDVIEVSEAEVWMEEPSYTVDTLRRLAPEGELYMLCGSDMFLSLDTWREPREIFRLCTVVCGSRIMEPEIKKTLYRAAEGYRERYGGRCTVIDCEPLEVSSTEIRAAIARGEMPDGICDSVADIIKENRLYGWSGGSV